MVVLSDALATLFGFALFIGFVFLFLPLRVRRLSRKTLGFAMVAAFIGFGVSTELLPNDVQAAREKERAAASATRDAEEAEEKTAREAEVKREAAAKLANQIAQAVSATDLTAEFEQNEVAADAHHKGNKVLVKGTIEDIGLDILKTPYVTFAVGRPFGVQALFEKGRDEDLVAKFEKGQSLVLSCDYRTKLLNVLIENCALVD